MTILRSRVGCNCVFGRGSVTVFGLRGDDDGKIACNDQTFPIEAAAAGTRL